MACAVFPVYTLLRASILDFRPELGNRCKVFPVYGHSRASILDFRGSIWESLQVFPRLRLFACSDSIIVGILKNMIVCEEKIWNCLENAQFLN